MEEMIARKPPTKDVLGKSVTETHTNNDMSNMLLSLEPYLSTAKGKFGYAVARNVRKIHDACEEFLQAREDLIREIGEPTKDDKGKETGDFSIKIGSPEFFEFSKRIDDFACIEHEVEIYKVSYDVLPEDLTAQDMLNLEWMLFE